MREVKKSADILVGALAGQELGPGLVVLPGQGNSLAIETDAGVVVLDASGHRHAPRDDRRRCGRTPMRRCTPSSTATAITATTLRSTCGRPTTPTGVTRRPGLVAHQNLLAPLRPLSRDRRAPAAYGRRCSSRARSPCRSTC